MNLFRLDAGVLKMPRGRGSLDVPDEGSAGSSRKTSLEKASAADDLFKEESPLSKEVEEGLQGLRRSEKPNVERYLARAAQSLRKPPGTPQEVAAALITRSAPKMARDRLHALTLAALALVHRSKDANFARRVVRELGLLEARVHVATVPTLTPPVSDLAPKRLLLPNPEGNPNIREAMVNALAAAAQRARQDRIPIAPAMPKALAEVIYSGPYGAALPPVIASSPPTHLAALALHMGVLAQETKPQVSLVTGYRPEHLLPETVRGLLGEMMGDLLVVEERLRARE